MEIEKDYYAVLNISTSATFDEIRRAYRKYARRFHPDNNETAETPDMFRTIQEAYETLIDPAARRKYDRWRQHQGLDRSSALHLQAVGSHKTLRAMRQEQAYYVCVDIMPRADLPTLRLPLNVCLVIDRSTSMQGMRLYQIKEAIRHIIDQLRSDDTLGLVVFSDRAEVMIESQSNIDSALAKSIVSTIQPSGGTEILQGIQAGLKEIQRRQDQNSVDHLILLTDGQTYGDEEGCLEQAKWAGANRIHFSAIGIGSDWNEELLDQMATLSGGTSIYIDSPDKVKHVFSETMHNLETIVARGLTMKLNLNSNISLHEVFQIAPHISRLHTVGDSIKLGALSANQEQMVLLEFRVKGLPAGECRLMRITVEGDMPGRNKHRPWEWIELMANVSEAPALNTEVPKTIAAALGKLAIFKMQEKVVTDLQAGQIDTATHRLKIMATQLLDLGETKLAHAALLEAGQLAHTRALSAGGRKTIRYGTRALSVVANGSAPLRATAG